MWFGRVGIGAVSYRCKKGRTGRSQPLVDSSTLFVFSLNRSSRRNTHLGGREDREGKHDPVGVLLADLGDEEGSHAGACAATEGVGDLEALEAVAGLGLLADDVEDGVDELRTLGVVALGPVVTGSGLAEHEVVRAEELAEGAGADGVHGSRLEVHEDGAGDVAACSERSVHCAQAKRGRVKEAAS